nr:MAG TPA: hypothetical protein [Caudoviricetes sp.]
MNYLPDNNVKRDTGRIWASEGYYSVSNFSKLRKTHKNYKNTYRNDI